VYVGNNKLEKFVAPLPVNCSFTIYAPPFDPVSK